MSHSSLYMQIESTLNGESFAYVHAFKEEGIVWKEFSNTSAFDGYSVNAFLGFKDGKTYFAETARNSEIKEFSAFDEWKSYHDQSMAKYPILIRGGMI